jgi:starch synthase (maltosyl-transferring)
LILAATLGASYGIYSGFELFENRPAAPGSEEYLESEKYQYRRWNWEQPNRLNNLIRTVNIIRHTQPALQYNDSLQFHLTTSDDLIAYSKAAPGGPRILTVVSLDPLEPRDGWVCVSLPDDTVEDDEVYTVRDLLAEHRYVWRGAWNYVRLEPTLPAHILHVDRMSRA